MPTDDRRGKARWGYRPKLKKLPVDDDLFDDLAEICVGNLDDAERLDAFWGDLDNEFDLIQTANFVDDTSVKLRDQLAALEIMRSDALRLYWNLRRADLDTRVALALSYSLPRFRRGRQTGLEDIEWHPLEGDIKRRRTEPREMLARDIERARQFARRLSRVRNLKRKEMRENDGGRIGNPHLRFACQKLAELYEKHSRKRFTLDRHPHAATTLHKKGDKPSDPVQEFITDGAKFVASATLAIYPDATATELDTAMRKVDTSRP